MEEPKKKENNSLYITRDDRLNYLPKPLCLSRIIMHLTTYYNLLVINT